MVLLPLGLLVIRLGRTVRLFLVVPLGRMVPSGINVVLEPMVLSTTGLEVVPFPGSNRTQIFQTSPHPLGQHFMVPLQLKSLAQFDTHTPSTAFMRGQLPDFCGILKLDDVQKDRKSSNSENIGGGIKRMVV